MILTSFDITFKMQQAVALFQQGELDQAEALCNKILHTQSTNVDALHLRGIVALQKGHTLTAIDFISKVIAINPNLAEAHNNLGNALGDLNRHKEALLSYDHALQIKPDFVEALVSRGATLEEMNRFEDALDNYNRSLEFRPDYTEAYYNKGNALRGMHQLEESLASYDRAIQLKPDYADALYNLGCTLSVLNRDEEAVKTFERLLEVAPDYDYAFGTMFHSQLHCCEWSHYSHNADKIITQTKNGKPIILPFFFLSVSQSAAEQLHCARIRVANKYSAAQPPMWTCQLYQHKKIHLAYLSPDFNNHAVAYLITGLFESHDKELFEITAISFGVDDKSDIRQRLQRSFHRFIDVRSKSDLEVAQLLAELKVDIIIDLGGFTQNSRPRILAHRPAPIQVNYLGYPGTMGADYIDYIIADRHIIPEDHQAYYSENVVYLPDTYQANDSKRSIANIKPTHAEVKLPKNGFVFCCFNNNYKISPIIFDIWMRLLNKVEGSVLWLLEGNPVASRNLRFEAEQRGVAPERLVFASRMNLDQHLARHQLADLFLDTLPYNAHTTASDALWAGLPVVTCMGNTFAGRVAGSLLHAVGLPELITHTLKEYEELALKLATTPKMLSEVRLKLTQHRTTYPLFNTNRYCRHIESAYLTMWERYQRSEPHTSFSVEPIQKKQGHSLAYLSGCVAPG